MNGYFENKVYINKIDLLCFLKAIYDLRATIKRTAMKQKKKNRKTERARAKGPPPKIRREIVVFLNNNT